MFFEAASHRQKKTFLFVFGEIRANDELAKGTQNVVLP